jgi:TusA-related sulfurtransferase
MLLEITALVDARGLQGAFALPRAKQVLLALDPGSVVEVLVDDADAPEAIVDWCVAHGHAIVERSFEGSVHRLVIRRK